MFDLAHILAIIVLLFFTLWDMLQRAFNTALGFVSSACNIVFNIRNFFSVGQEYPVGVASRSRPRNKRRGRALGRSPGMIGRVASLFGITSIVSLFAGGDPEPFQVHHVAYRRPSLVACLAWISRAILQRLCSLAITLSNFAATCINKAKEWNPFNYFALLCQLEVAQREARLLEEGLYQSTVEIKNLKALYKIKERENLDLVRRVAEVEKDHTLVVEDLEARLEEKGKTLEEEKQALVQKMEILRKDQDVEIEVLKMEKDAEIDELKEQSRVVEERNAEHIAALMEENDVLREERAAVVKENEILKEENTKIEKRVEEVQVEAKVAQEKARAASAQLFGMEIARKEGKKRMEAESMVVILREELEIAKQDIDVEKKGREAERVAMELERAAFAETTRKSIVEHRQEIDAFVGQLQGAWNRALDLNSQLDLANHQNNALQAHLKDAQDSLATISEQKKTLGLENQDLQEEASRLREVARVGKKKEVEEKEQRVESKVATDFGIDLEMLKRNFEARDRLRKDAHGGDETAVADEASVMDGEDTVLDITIDRLDTPRHKKRPAIKIKATAPSDAPLVETKGNLVIGTDIPVVRLPAAGTTRILPPIQASSVDTHIPPVEVASMVPLSFDPAPIQVGLPTAPERPIGKDSRGNSRSSWPVKSKEAASVQHKKPKKSRRGLVREQGDAPKGTFDRTFRSPLQSIMNQSSQKHTGREVYK